ncbi:MULTISPECIES: hypothetical protein [Sporosarcina]|uniref:hypothetical protein n=1 Tax=Sporosarcina TaxID=1569 RepID=UPI000A17ABD0|nr:MULTISPECIES: hypothetical protein [Sporosarcina]ARK21220.1 hypothetical protein SporoP32a_06580 [Sporosarcina ureae]PIC73480.1 hypothetical protein CSV76_10390 [Sporosarcina sp. P17b]
MEQHENSSEKKELIIRQTQEINTLHQEVDELRKEVKQLREDIDLIDVFQKKPVITAAVIGQIGSFIIAILVIIGIFF